ncbi:unnamed protein product [Amoebophrya sp. A25]|nr:unnamed protein product [Amoebophrya sp. A25]|eukprot:GSA25T00016822001.1
MLLSSGRLVRWRAVKRISQRGAFESMNSQGIAPTPASVTTTAKRAFAGVKAELEYQVWPQKSETPMRIGRYIDRELPSTGATHVDEHQPVPINISSGRGVDCRLDREGFTFVENEPLPENLDVDSVESIKDVYYKNIQDLVKRQTGCSKVLVFDHTLRNSGQTNLNVLNDAKAAAASVVRVHCDYTADSAPIRLRQLARTASYTGDKFDAAMVDDVLKSGKRFAFINLWRSIDKENPVKVKPLSVCDYRSVDMAKDALLYELVYNDRVGENYSLAPEAAGKHSWFYWPDMTSDEVIMFNVYDRDSMGAPFVFHTAFADPSTPADAPARKSIEVRAVAIWDDEIVAPERQTRIEVANNKPVPVFYDMLHSNNAARCRLWLQMKGVPQSECKTVMITYADLQDPEYAKINPVKKVPAFQAWRKVLKEDIPNEDLSKEEIAEAEASPWNYFYAKQAIFESHVVMQYLERRFNKAINPERSFIPDSPELTAKMDLLCRVHDVYVASPNSTQPGFTHTQGCMYLAPYPTQFCAAERCIDRATREARLQELWRQLNWFEEQFPEKGNGEYLCGTQMTHADMTWFPTICFMEYLLPRNFGWDDITRAEGDALLFPKMGRWFQYLRKTHPEFEDVRSKIFNFFAEKDEAGMFEGIRNEILDPRHKWLFTRGDLLWNKRQTQK